MIARNMAEPETDKRPESGPPTADAPATTDAEAAKHPSSRPAKAADAAKAPSVSKELVAKAASVPPSGRASVKTSAGAARYGHGSLDAYEAVARSARLPDLVAVAQKILGDAATARRAGWDFAARVSTIADEAKLSGPDADTPFGNVLKVLGTGAEGESERRVHHLRQEARKAQAQDGRQKRYVDTPSVHRPLQI